MRLFTVVLAIALSASFAIAQTDRGTITGSVIDPAGAVVAEAPIEARNIETGALHLGATTGTGNYTLSQLPVGTYTIAVSVPGFKTYLRQGIAVGVAQTLRIDIALEVGAASESVTVTDVAPLLKTESGDLSHNVAAASLNALPILGVGSAAGSHGVRNPLAASQLLPGTTYTGNSVMRVNGAQGNTQSIRIEGQDSSNAFISGLTQHTQPSVDAIQEISIQTSNFAAEYGQVGGGFFNFTMKSGTNDYHGTAYDYFVNEALNAGQAFTDNGNGGHIRQVQRRNDYGFTFGGPIRIPGLYDGHDRSFFFFNWEQYRESRGVNNQALTVPIQEYRDGNFSQAYSGRQLGTDSLGRTLLEGAVYDPNTQYEAGGVVVRDPFPGNVIPASMLDPVSVKIQRLIPAPTMPGLVNNGIYPWVSDRVTSIPAIKLDHSLNSNAKLSFYYSRTGTESAFATGPANGDGLPLPITAGKGTYIYADTYRVNIDYTLSPTLLLHLGAGYVDNDFNSTGAVENYDTAAELGLTGSPIVRQFPEFTGLSAARGGMKDMGPNNVSSPYFAKPTANASLTWVKDNHTFKTGAEMRLEGYIGRIWGEAVGRYTFSANQTGLPATQGQNLQGGTLGFPYASFLLGRVDTVNVSQPPVFRLGKQQWGFFAQDTWKATRKLTLDYGLRYDYSTYLREQYGRLINFGPNTPNPAAGNRLGATIFEGNLPGRCNCNFASNYALAFAPRLGMAYQITPKTVLRAGWGIVYSGTPDANGAANRYSPSSPIGSAAFGEPSMLLRNGIQLPQELIQWPNFDPGQYPKADSLNAPPVAIDQNAGRPARQVQWSIGLQREISSNLVVEASYVGNRGVWWNSPGLIDPNALTPQGLAAHGLNINNTADRNLLTARMDSSAAAARGFNVPLYPGYPLETTVAQSLRPYPQFDTITYWWSPLGKTWYDSLQAKLTKRLSYGLSFTSVFTWQKNLVMGSQNLPTVGTAGTTRVNDVFNRNQNKAISQYDQPFVFNMSVEYIVPSVAGLNGPLNWLAKDWTVGAFFAYGSGTPILSPAAQNRLSSHLFRGTYANRVPGVPLFTQDINGDFDPNQDFVLNPAAWEQPVGGAWGTSAAYYTDYRSNRQPQENLNIGRTFRIGERATFNIRAEFTNVFNRTVLNNPTSTNSLATQNRNASGKPISGFGWINTASVAIPPREGVIVGRFSF